MGMEIAGDDLSARLAQRNSVQSSPTFPSNMIEPFLSDEALVANIHSARDDGTNFHLWWLGQSGFLIKWQGRYLLLDPYLSESLTEKYATTDKPHVRMTRRCVAPEKLGFVDVVTSSHVHTDHFDAHTLVPISMAHGGPLPMILPSANLEEANNRLAGGKFQFLEMDAGTTAEFAGYHLTAIPSAHDTVEMDEQWRCKFLGYIVRFGPWTIYHSGDTRLFDALPDLLKRHRPELVLLPINGHDPARRVAGNLNGTEAAELAKSCGARLVIPHHFDMFEFNTAAPDEFLSGCSRLWQPCKILKCGEPWHSSMLE